MCLSAVRVVSAHPARLCWDERAAWLRDRRSRDAGHAVELEQFRVLRILNAARSRCQNPNVPNYADYGGRGIQFFEGWRGWHGAGRFMDHIGPRPSPRHTVDRVNNNGNYEPGNVRWATRKEQRANRRDSLSKCQPKGTP